MRLNQSRALAVFFGLFTAVAAIAQVPSFAPDVVFKGSTLAW